MILSLFLISKSTQSSFIDNCVDFEISRTIKKNLTVESYIEKYKSIAISEMLRAGIPASIKLAQGILESRYGSSYLAQNANNHFGIKCHKWKGDKIYRDDDKKDDCFRVYESGNESYIAHSEFLLTNARYSNLFSLSPTDYQSWAHELKKAGYATNSQYAYLLIQTIEKHNLDRFDSTQNIFL